MDIKDLPLILPEAIAWATENERAIRVQGVGLIEHGITMAQRVGIQRPELVRVQFVTQLPLPPETMRLRQLAEGMGFQSMSGVTLGYGMYIVKEHMSNTLLCHELRHVQQYESMGGIAPFMEEYLRQVLTHGYMDSPLEVDARAHEHLAE